MILGLRELIASFKITKSNLNALKEARDQLVPIGFFQTWLQNVTNQTTPFKRHARDRKYLTFGAED